MKIPTYQGQGGTPWAPEPNKIPVGVYRDAAIADAGVGMQEAGSFLAQVEEKRRRARQTTELLGHQTNYLKDLYDLKGALLANPDFEKSQAGARQSLDELHKKYLGQIKDPEVKQVFQRSMLHPQQAALQYLDEQFNNKRIDHGKAVLGESIDTLSKLYTQAGSETEKQVILGQLKGAIAGATSAGFVNETHGGEMWRKASENATQMAIRDKIEKEVMADPVGTMKRLETNYADYGLDADQARQYRGFARSEIHRRQEDNVLQVEKAFRGNALTIPQVDAMVNSQALSVTAGNHYRAAIEGLAKAKLTSDPAVWVPIREAAMAGVLKEVDLVDRMKTGQLTAQDANMARNINKEAQRNGTWANDEYLKLIKQTLKASLGIDQLSGLGPEGRSDLYEEAMAKVYDLASKEPAPGQPPLRGRALFDAAKEVIAPYIAGQALEEPPTIKGKGSHPNVIKGAPEGLPPIPPGDERNFDESGKPKIFGNPSTRKRYYSDGKKWIEYK